MKSFFAGFLDAFSHDQIFAMRQLGGIASFPLLILGMIFLVLDKVRLGFGLVAIAFILATIWGFDVIGLGRVWISYATSYALLALTIISIRFSRLKTIATRNIGKAVGVLLLVPVAIQMFALSSCAEGAIQHYGAGF